jgi:DNA topoisomerase-1
MRFKFRGKSGQDQDIEIDDPRIAKIVKKSRDIPGFELFQYIDDSGENCRITSTDVNNYIREITGEDFTAKDFRTWGGTGWAALVFEELGPAADESEAKKRVVEAIKAVSQKLGNRPATCKKYYVHPAILDAYSDGSLFNALNSCSGARRQEACVMSVVTDYVKKMADQQVPHRNLHAIPSRGALPRPAGEARKVGVRADPLKRLISRFQREGPHHRLHHRE